MWLGTNPTQMQSEGHRTESMDSLLPHSFGFSHATWHFSECTHRSSPPTVVRSDNPIITAILNGLFCSEVSQATVCTASPPALTRLCRFMQIRSNPWNAGDSGSLSRLAGLFCAIAFGLAEASRWMRERVRTGERETKGEWMREVWSSFRRNRRRETWWMGGREWKGSCQEIKQWQIEVQAKGWEEKDSKILGAAKAAGRSHLAVLLQLWSTLDFKR